MKNDLLLNCVAGILSSFCVIFFFTSCMAEKSPLLSVKKLNAARYSGKWYEIARTPNPFERDLTGITAEYTLLDDGSIKVVNSGFLPDGRKKSITGQVRFSGKNGAQSGDLAVTFFWPFYGEYKIVKLAEDYSYSIVVSGKKYLWILSRTPELKKEDMKKVLAFLEKHSYKKETLIFCEQN